ncbi:MAG: hypothetical protein NTU53_21170 [Planctomycetota bacterium]|nr:hypothetical protein [Planctomycetota bacterium]
MNESEQTIARRSFLKTVAATAIVPALIAKKAHGGESLRIIPVVASDWVRVADYTGSHLNDFCLFRGLDDRWHAIGIMGTGTWASETSLFHCSSAKLLGQYEIHEPLLVNLERGATANASPQKHAPFVVVSEGMHHLYFRRPPGTNLHLASPDVFRWPAMPDVVFEQRDARDACIQRFEKLWHWYYVQQNRVDGVERSCVMLRTSPDLLAWTAARPAFVDFAHEVVHSKLESPFVIQHDGVFYLFVRDRNREDAANPAPVTVWASETPERFASTGAPLTIWPDVHAPEIVAHENKWYVARVSGVSHACGHRDYDRHGWIEIAELRFARVP